MALMARILPKNRPGFAVRPRKSPLKRLRNIGQLPWFGVYHRIGLALAPPVSEAHPVENPGQCPLHCGGLSVLTQGPSPGPYLAIAGQSDAKPMPSAGKGNYVFLQSDAPGQHRLHLPGWVTEPFAALIQEIVQRPK